MITKNITLQQILNVILRKYCMVTLCIHLFCVLYPSVIFWYLLDIGDLRVERTDLRQYSTGAAWVPPLWDHIIHNSYLSYLPTAYLSPERITQIKTHCPTHTTYHHSIYHHVLNEYWRYKQMVGRKQGHKENEADSWYRWGGRWRT